MSFTGHPSTEDYSFGGLRATRSLIPQIPSAEIGQPTMEDLAKENRALKRKIRRLDIDIEELTEQRDEARRHRDEAILLIIQLEDESIDAPRPSKKRAGSPMEATNAKVVKGYASPQPAVESSPKVQQRGQEGQHMPLEGAFNLASREHPQLVKSDQENGRTPTELEQMAEAKQSRCLDWCLSQARPG